MFGGMAFLVKGNMCCGVHRDSLVVRLDPSEIDRSLSEPHARVFALTGRPMKGEILVESEGLGTAAQLGTWVDRAAKYAGSLPAKQRGRFEVLGAAPPNKGMRLPMATSGSKVSAGPTMWACS